MVVQVLCVIFTCSLTMVKREAERRPSGDSARIYDWTDDESEHRKSVVSKESS